MNAQRKLSTVLIAALAATVLPIYAEPPPNVVDALRRIFTRPAHAAGDAAPAANAA